MSNWQRFLIVLSLAVWGTFLQAKKPLYAQELRIITENSGQANFVNEKGEIAGYSFDIVKEIMNRQGNRYSIEVMPWARGYKLLQLQNNIVLFSTTRTKTRENQFKWVGPLMVIEWVLYGKKDTSIAIKSLEEAKKVRSIGVYKDDARHLFFEKNGFENIEVTYGVFANVTNLKKLLINRIDLIASSNSGIVKTCADLGVPTTVVKPVYTLKRSYLYIAFSKSVQDSVVNQWQITLNKMKKDGSYTAIMKKYTTGEMVLTFDPNQEVQ